MVMNVPSLQISGLGKRFGPRVLFNHLQLDLAAGESVALIGESGSGKSTLLNLIAGLDRCDEGQILIAGTNIQTLNEDDSAQLRRRSIGFVFQAFHLLPHLNATQNVALPLLLLNQPSAGAMEQSRRLLTKLGLGTRLDAMPSVLSGGEQQRVALARALVHQPRVILADEPTGNLDTESAELAMTLLFNQCREQSASLLMVTHSEAAAARCQRIFKLGPGGLKEQRLAAERATP
jgi:putative ABC transport system ATP-binding protein